MATGDIISVTVRADGWSLDVVQEGDCTAGTYDFGLAANNVPGASTPYLTVVSQGYNSAGVLGTVTRRVYWTAIVRKAYPDQADLDQTYADPNTTTRVALSDFVYDDDKSAEGGSGTNPVAVFPAGWCTVGESSNAASAAFAVTNSSTLDYPQAFGQWAMVPYQRFTSNPTLRFTARHRFGIARVAYTLTDAAAHTATAAATSQTARLRSGSGLYANEYAAEVALTALDQNSVLTARAQLYPVVGDADSIFDTNAITANDDNRALGQCDLPHFCDKSAALTVTKYVATTGNDTTGDGSAGTPWLTIGKALTEGSATDIVLAAGTYNLLGSAVTAPASLGFVRTVKPATGAAVILQIDDTKAYNTPHLCYQGVTVQMASGSNQWIDGGTGARYLWFDACTFDINSLTPNLVAPSYRSACMYMTDCTMDSGIYWGIGTDFAARETLWIDGCVIASPSAHCNIRGVMRAVANRLTNCSLLNADNDSTTCPFQDPWIIESNKFIANQAATATVHAGLTTAIAKGISLVGNQFEKVNATTPCLSIAGDNSAVDVAHVLLWNNTWVGSNGTNGRANLGYNEVGSTALARLNWSLKYNAGAQFNNKDDTFAGTPDAGRIGSWPVGYGVGFYGNRWEETLFAGEFAGLDAATTDITYVDDKTGSGGAGDYHPAANSVLRSRIPSGGTVIPYDLTGVTFGATGNGSAGAYQYELDLNSPPTATITSAATQTAVEGDTVTLTGTGTDDEDGPLTGAVLAWSSDIDGALGTGTSLEVSDLGVGEHTITLTVTDSGGLTDTDTCTVTVNAKTAPVLTTAAVTGTTYVAAICGGTISSDGGEAVTARGVCWNTTGTPTIADSKTSDGTGTGTFASIVRPLERVTAYYVRAYATNSIGTGYGVTAAFVTPDFQSYSVRRHRVDWNADDEGEV